LGKRGHEKKQLGQGVQNGGGLRGSVRKKEKDGSEGEGGNLFNNFVEDQGVWKKD